MFFLILIGSGTLRNARAQTTVGPFTFTATTQSGVLQGKATISGAAAATGDIIGVFDSSGNTAGAATVIINAGSAFINVTIYGDDSTTLATDEGMNGGENFFLKLFDASSGQTLALGTGFSGWQNTNGSPMPGYNNPNTVFDFPAPITTPSAPVLSSPANSATVINTTQTLTWSTDSNVSTYAIEVATDINFTTVIFQSPAVSASTIDANGLSFGTQYFWRVRGTNSAGTSPWSDTRTFSVAILNPPDVPTLLAPGNTSANNPLAVALDWSDVNQVSSYDVQVSGSSTFSSFVLNATGVVASTKTVTGLSFLTTYFWRVRAVNGAGNSAWTAPVSFTTLAPDIPAVPVLTTPVTNATGIATSSTLMWDSVSGADNYDVQVSLVSDFSTTTAVFDAVTAQNVQVTGLANLTAYFWRVRAGNVGGKSSWSAAHSFTTVPPDAPAIPVLSAPAAAATGQELTLNLSWNSSSGATQYDVQVSTSSTFDNLFESKTLTGAVAYALSGLSNLTMYYWRVRAGNAGGNSAWSASRSFTTRAPDIPAAPVLVFPADQSGGAALALTLSWSAVSGATSYNLEVSNSTDFSSTIVSTANSGNTTFSLSGLAFVTSYFWRVSATNAGGTSPWSNVFRFQTGAPAQPGSPSLTTPLNAATGITTSPVLAWNILSNASNYMLQVSTSADFSAPLVSETALTSTSWQLSGLGNLTEYFWRVRGTNAGGDGVWSDTRSFTTIVALPGTPVLTAPQDNATDIRLPMAFSWNAGTDASSYDLQVSVTSDFSTTQLSDIGLTATSRSPSGLAFSTRYYWRVRSVNAAGTSDWSATMTFATVVAPPGVPVPGQPEDGSIDVSLTVSLMWSSSMGALSYFIEVATDDSFSDIVASGGPVSDPQFTVSGLKNDRTYFWRVRASNPGGLTAWSTTFRFATIIAVPDRPELLTPANNTQGSSETPVLTWLAAPRATTYEVQVATSDDFSVVINTAANLQQVFYSVPQLQTLTLYYWRVRAVNRAGIGPWSLVRTFTTRAPDPPEVPLSILPGDAEEHVSVLPDLTWAPAPRATEYDIDIAIESSFSTRIQEVRGTTATSVRAAELLFETRYFWRIRASNPGGISPWSAVHSFTTAALEAPIEAALDSPPDRALDLGPDVELNWEPQPGDETYDIQVSQFGAIVIDTTGVRGPSFRMNRLAGGVTFFWRVRARNVVGVGDWSSIFAFTTALSTAVGDESDLPGEFSLQQNYPNPFRNQTRVRYAVAKASDVTLTLFDMRGRLISTVLTGTHAPGTYETIIDASALGLASGSYVYRMIAGSRSVSKIVTVVK